MKKLLLATLTASLVVSSAFAGVTAGNYKGNNGNLSIKQNMQFSYDSDNGGMNMCMIDGTFQKQGNVLQYEEQNCKMVISAKSANAIHLEVSGDCSYFCGMGASVDTEDMSKK
ncbi:hypothetical protein [Sulfurimonas sp.]|uniref:hypothetical protein n=1 Tax=Sulfurimonas sp. TaxID=2022749 RepID=UPI003D10D2BB